MCGGKGDGCNGTECMDAAVKRELTWLLLSKLHDQLGIITMNSQPDLSDQLGSANHMVQ
jgi:hypothetical protein